jgi:hypothetical protein
LQQIEREYTSSELDANNIRRQKLKEAFSLKMSSIFEAAERLAIISGFGLDLIEKFDATPDVLGSTRPKYSGMYEKPIFYNLHNNNYKACLTEF